MNHTARRLAALALGAVLAGQAGAQELIVGRPATSSAPTAKEAADANALPPGAPADDYEFLGWCTGILTGHMQLYAEVKPELDAISKRWNTVESDAKQQAEQQVIGREMIAQFRRAMTAVEANAPAPISPRGQAAVQKGLAIWSEAAKVDKQAKAYSWMNFGMPARCENKAAEIEKAGGKLALAAPPPAGTPAAKAADLKAPIKPVVKSAPTASQAGLRR